MLANDVLVRRGAEIHFEMLTIKKSITYCMSAAATIEIAPASAPELQAAAAAEAGAEQRQSCIPGTVAEWGGNGLLHEL